MLLQHLPQKRVQDITQRYLIRRGSRLLLLRRMASCDQRIERLGVRMGAAFLCLQRSTIADKTIADHRESPGLKTTSITIGAKPTPQIIQSLLEQVFEVDSTFICNGRGRGSAHQPSKRLP